MTEEYKRFAVIDGKTVTDVPTEPIDWSKYSQDTQYVSQPITMVVCSGVEHLGKGIPTVSEKRHCGVVTINPTTGTPEQYRDYIVVDEAPFHPNIVMGLGTQCPTRPLNIPTLSLSDKVLSPNIKQPHPFDRFIKNYPTSHRWKARR